MNSMNRSNPVIVIGAGQAGIVMGYYLKRAGIEHLIVGKEKRIGVLGMYFLGLPWQYNRGSALLGGVAADAEYVLRHIVSDSSASSLK